MTNTVRYRISARVDVTAKADLRKRPREHLMTKDFVEKIGKLS